MGGVVAALAVACRHPASPRTETTPLSVVRPPQKLEIAQQVYDGALVNDWQDWGWAPQDKAGAGPARIRFSDWGGWILAKPGLTGDFGGLVFRVKAPQGNPDFLEVRVESNSSSVFPRIKVSPEHRTEDGDGYSRVFVSMSELDPDGLPFDRIILRAFRPVDSRWVLIDKIALTKGSASEGRDAVSYDPATLPRVDMAVDCNSKSTKISDLIYGIAYYAFNDEKKQAAQWLVGATARRWGGNPASTYNWEISAWNTGNDYFFENHDVDSYARFLEDDAAHRMASALTVPIMGWVSKDKTSYSFPVSVFGPQDGVDGWQSDAGNGKEKGTGKLVKPGPPTRAYVPITPAYVKRWVETIRAADAKTGKRSVAMYILDNEPALWSGNHRDAHPDPASYDEVVQRAIDYGTAIRQADPDAVIAGPAEWGWTGYMYSAKDMAEGGPALRPDRRAHGDLPMVAYYLKALAEHERATGVRILDVFDLHGYPYADRVWSDASDPDVAALRIRTTRMLWDPTYVDESWVREPVQLLPRMREWVERYYPGLGISIGEWNFGGEAHMSGGLATAEALGRFAQFGVTSAFYWTYPSEGTPAMWAFRAYRDFDGKGGKFLDWYTPSTSGPNASLFVSRDASGRHAVAIILNLSRQTAISAKLDLSSCGSVASSRAFSYRGGSEGFVPGAASAPHRSTIVEPLAPYSITVVDLRLDNATPVAH